MFLLVRTAHRRYAVRQDDVFALRTIDMRASDDDRSLVKADLGAMFDPEDRSSAVRRHGLIVPLRRKQIVLMVDQVDLYDRPGQVLELPTLLRARLTQPWAVGILAVDDDFVVHVDLRAVARSVLLAPQM